MGMQVSPKEETWSYWEIEYIKQNGKALPEELKVKLEKLLQELEDRKNNSVLFFMPEQTWSFFSMLQEQTVVCCIEQKDVQELLKGAKAMEEGPERGHFVHKLQVLLDYLSAGNKVKPVVITSDNFSRL